MLEEKNIVKEICFIPITFDHPIKTCFSNKKYPVAIQADKKQIVSSIFLIDYIILIILMCKINCLSFFGIALILKARNPTPHKIFSKFNILSHNKSYPKVMQNFGNYSRIKMTKTGLLFLQSHESKIIFVHLRLRGCIYLISQTL